MSNQHRLRTNFLPINPISIYAEAPTPKRQKMEELFIVKQFTYQNMIFGNGMMTVKKPVETFIQFPSNYLDEEN